MLRKVGSFNELYVYYVICFLDMLYSTMMMNSSFTVILSYLEATHFDSRHVRTNHFDHWREFVSPPEGPGHHF